MNKLFLVNANCISQNIREITKEQLIKIICELMEYSLEDKPELLEIMSLSEIKKLMIKNSIDILEWIGILECGTYAIYNVKDVREIEDDNIPFMYDLDDLLDCEFVKKYYDKIDEICKKYDSDL